MGNRQTLKLLRADIERRGLSLKQYAETVIFRGERTLRRWLNDPANYPVDSRISQKLQLEESERERAAVSVWREASAGQNG